MVKTLKFQLWHFQNSIFFLSTNLSLMLLHLTLMVWYFSPAQIFGTLLVPTRNLLTFTT